MNNDSGNINNQLQENRKPLKIDKSLLLSLLLVLVNFTPPGVLTIALTIYISFFYLTTLKVKPPYLFYGAVFFIAMITVGMIGLVNNNLYNFAKDLWYFTNPFLILLFGFIVAKSCLTTVKILQSLVVSGTVIACIHIIQVLVYVLNNQFIATEIRENVSPGYFIVLISLLILLGEKKIQIQIFKENQLSALLTSLCTISLILSFSRTMWLIVIICISIIYNWIPITKVIKFTITGVILFTALIALSANISIDDSYSDSDEITMAGKIKNSFQEMLVKDYSDMADINANWRGFESYRALQSYINGNVFQYVFGQGFGAMVPLGFTMKLGEGEYDEIPILHNGYFFLLIKTGIVGIVCFLMIVLSGMKLGKNMSLSPNLEIKFIGYILVCLEVIYFFTTLVITGFFNSGLVDILILNGLVFGLHAKYNHEQTVRLSQ